MKKVVFFLAAVTALWSQNPNSAKFPAAVAADKNLGVQVNNLTGSISAAMVAGDTQVAVNACTNVVNDMNVTIDNEILHVCSCTASTMKFGISACGNADGRGLDGTTAASHASGTSWFAYLIALDHNQTAAEVKALESELEPGVTTLTDGVTITWALANHVNQQAKVTLGGNRTLNITGPTAVGYYTLYVIQDATGSRGLTLGTGCTWKVSGGGAGAITPSTAANAIDVLTFTYDGTNCYANFNKNFS